MLVTVRTYIGCVVFLGVIVLNLNNLLLHLLLVTLVSNVPYIHENNLQGR